MFNFNVPLIWAVILYSGKYSTFSLCAAVPVLSEIHYHTKQWVIHSLQFRMLTIILQATGKRT
jgi:hypothetical protein